MIVSHFLIKLLIKTKRIQNAQITKRISFWIMMPFGTQDKKTGRSMLMHSESVGRESSAMDCAKKKHVGHTETMD